MGRLVAPEEFWVELRAGAKVVAAARAVGVSHWIGYRWLAEAGGPDALGLERRVGRPWGGRKSEEVRDVFWAALRRGAAITVAAQAAGVARRTGTAWLIEAGGVRPRVRVPELEASVVAGSGLLSFVDRCRIEDLIKAGYRPSTGRAHEDPPRDSSVLGPDKRSQLPMCALLGRHVQADKPATSVHMAHGVM